MLSIRAVGTLEELAGLSDEWTRLLARTPSNQIFLTWEWLNTWARHYLHLRRSTLFVLVVCDEDCVVGIAPLLIRRTREYGVPVRRVEFLGTEEVCSSYLDVIVQDDKRQPVLAKIYEYLYGDARGLWDVWCLAEVPAESATVDILYGMVQEDGRVIEVVGQTCCPQITLAGSEEDFLHGISANARYNLRRKRARLEKQGQAVYSCSSLSGDVQKDMDAFIQLHQMRWEQKGAGGSFQSRRFAEFHKEVSDVFSRRGWVHLDFLALDGEKVAGIYGYTYNGRYSFYLPGFNQHIAPQASPGTLLLYECVVQAIRDGCKGFDLLRGPADYKMAWANGLRRSLTLKLYNRTIRAAASKLLENGKGILKVLVR